MTQEGAVPPDFWQQIDKRIDQKVANSQRAASIRNASISSGGTFTIQGGAFVLEDETGTLLFYVGPMQPDRADGTPQQGWIVRRADGTTVLSLFDYNPTDAGGALQQALNWFDRTGHSVIADDTNGGEGIASPWLSMPKPVTTDASKWPSTTATTWTEISRSLVFEQSPKVLWQGDAYCPASGTGQVQLLIKDFSSNVLASGPVHTTSGSVIAFSDTITLPSGFWQQNNIVSVMARMTSGTGPVSAQTFGLYGRQT